MHDPTPRRCAAPRLRRRHTLAALAGALIGLPARAQVPLWQPVASPEPMAQVAAGGPSGLLGVSVTGALFELPLQPGRRARKWGDGLDASTPLALGHGRIAARRRDGALWVLEAGRSSVSVERTLAPAAGLLVLPLAVIVIASEGPGHRAVRLEPDSGGAWRAVARSEAPVMPDARPLQADLDGRGDGGHVVVLAGPDSARYAHGALGDAIEATRVHLLERHSLGVLRELVLDAPQVFEDIAPRRVSLGARDGLLTVQSGPLGARLVLIEADPAVPGALRRAAAGPPLGTANRWMAPTTDGRQWLAVHTPHIGGVLQVYRQQGAQLLAREVRAGVSNHRLGSRTLDLSAWQGSTLVIPDASGRRLLSLDSAADWRLVGEHEFPARVAATVALGDSGRVAVLLEDGSVLAQAV